ncbi:MAG: hypothetical protein AAGF11_28755 [Myxococcota bacterium]
MTRQRFIVTTGAIGLLGLSGCADPCADDGLLQEMEGVCPMVTGADGTDGDSDDSDDATVTVTDTEGSMVTDPGSGSQGSGPGDGDCDNGVQDGDETDIDCGGSCEDKCDEGQGCEGPEDCASGQCDEMICGSPSCQDGLENGDETDVDCGGPDCDPCADGEDCQQGSDCQSQVCEDDTCQAPSCSDGVQNGDETDVDCGGDTCERCPTGDGCEDGEDCQSGVCIKATGECAPPTCDDGVQNSTETDLDCGGACGSTCEPGEGCLIYIDCIHLVCDANLGLCLGPTCDDGTPNGNETDVDCGGPECPGCDVPGQCEMDSDCLSGSCEEGQCVPPTCVDGELNGNETDVDCGGPECQPCQDGETCLEDGDCLSQTCDPGTGTCTPAACDDTVQNGEETDVDCGGPNCPGCDNGQTCEEDADCMSNLCDPVLDVCEDPSCVDGLQNGEETDVDCGGPDCAPCGDGQMCEDNFDCASDSCDGNVCQPPACDDGALNGLETDIDCGGPDCAPCQDGDDCLTDFDCESMVCLNEECQPASCSDSVLNGSETDVDCGGPDCQPCQDGDMCMVDGDCASDVCDPGTNTCSPPACNDGIQNADEADVDCGGPICDPCGDGQMCEDNDDCDSMVCNFEIGVCEPPNCADGVQNGSETDLDCGGMCGMTCNPGEGCALGGDCLSAGCDPGTSTCNDFLTVTTAPACSEFAGIPVTLTAVASGGTGGPYTYAWTPNDGSLSNPNSDVTDASPAGFQSYTVTVNDGVTLAQDTSVVANANPLDLQNNCTLFQADYNASSTGEPAYITYSMGGTVACELGNNEFGLHLCDQVVFDQARLQSTLEVTNANADDDWMGLVWGAQDASNFYSLVWKQSTQNFFGCATPAGVLVKRVQGPGFASLGGADFYCPNDTPNSTLLFLPTDPGGLSDGWVEGESYTVIIDHTATQSAITITRDSDMVELANFTIMDAIFPSGFFGSTTLSQENACVGPLLGSCL